MKRIKSPERPSTDDNFHRRLPLYRLLAVVLTAVAVIACCVQQIWRKDGDPYLFVHAARLLLQRQDIYLIPDQHGAYYYYPPFFACLIIPLTILPVEVVVVLWALASVGLLSWSMAAFYTGLTGQPFFSIPEKTRWVICFFATLLTARFIILHQRFGSANVFVLALAVLGLTLLTRKQGVRGGITLGLSMVLKLTTLPFGLWFLAKRNTRVLWGIVLGGLIGIALPAAVVGLSKDVSYHREWVEQVILFNGPGTGSWAGTGNVSLRAQADRFFLKADAFVDKGTSYRVTIVELPQPIVRLLGWFVMLGVALTIVFYAVRFQDAPELVSQWGGFAFVFSLIPIFSTVTLIPHLILLIPAYIYVVHVWYCRLTTDRVFRALVLLSFIFTSLTTKSFFGVFVSRMLAALGFIPLGILFLSAAIFRAASCIQRNANGAPFTPA
jgi:hypothetical protein